MHANEKVGSAALLAAAGVMGDTAGLAMRKGTMAPSPSHPAHKGHSRGPGGAVGRG